MIDTMPIKTFFAILKTVLISQILLIPDYVYSQKATDWNSWTSFGVNYNMTQSFRIRTKLEYRRKDNFSSHDRWSFNAGTGYKFNKYIELKGAYEIHHSYNKSGSWSFRHRYNLGAQGFYSIGNMKFSWRERFQQTFDGGKSEKLIRSRIKMDYMLWSTLIVPQFSIEFFQILDNGEFPEIFRTRYMPGVKFNISKQYSVLCFYCRQQQVFRDKNILGIDFTLNL